MTEPTPLEDLHAATGDGGGRPSVALGLALNLLTTLKRDIVGFD